MKIISPISSPHVIRPFKLYEHISLQSVFYDPSKCSSQKRFFLLLFFYEDSIYSLILELGIYACDFFLLSSVTDKHAYRDESPNP